MKVYFRILPLLIMCAVGALTVRAAGVFFGPDGGEDLAKIRALQPAAGPAPQLAQAGKKDGKKAQEKKAGEKPLDEGRGATVTSNRMPGPKKPRTSRERAPFRDLADITDSEVRLLRELSARREQLEKREKDLRHRGALLKAAEARMDEKLAQLKEVQKTVKELIAQKDEAEIKKVDRMVKVYQSMKPDQAAAILGKLQMPVLLDVVGRMKESKLGQILAAMPTEKAQELTLEMMRRRELIDAPPTGGQAGG